MVLQSCQFNENITNGCEKDKEFHERLSRLYPGVDDISKLPHSWSSEIKSPMLGLSNHNLRCYYRGSYRKVEENDKIPAAIRADNFIPPSCLLYYFEVKINSKGRTGFMGLGLASAQVPLNKLPGWSQESYGYHGDDGNKFDGLSNKGDNYGPTFTVGDVIGCGLNLIEGSCFFTKNGVNLGKAFKDMRCSHLLSLYPTIGLKTPGEEVEVNFGHESFVYDIEQDLRFLRKNLTTTISKYPISNFNDWQTKVHKLIQTWLIHNSYPKTAEAFSKLANIDFNENMQRMEQRFKIQQYVLEGKISDAIRLTNYLCPLLFENNPNLLFTLKCRQFVELVDGSEIDFNSDLKFDQFPTKKVTSTNGYSFKDNTNENRLALMLQFCRDLNLFAEQVKEHSRGQSEHIDKLLMDTVCLLAFKDPQSSRVGWQLRHSERELVAQLLNSSILKHDQGDAYRTPLEEVVNHINGLISLNNSQGKWLIDKLQY